MLNNPMLKGLASFLITLLPFITIPILIGLLLTFPILVELIVSFIFGLAILTCASLGCLVFLSYWFDTHEKMFGSSKKQH